MSSFVIITPAHNEAPLIGKTIDSMINQTVRPSRWVIVNDGSTDETQKVIEEKVRGHAFIQPLHLQRSGDRDFGRKVDAFMRGFELIKDIPYEYIGNLDADTSFEPNYFQTLLQKFDDDPVLGITGGIVHTKIGNGFVTQDGTLDSVAGAVQFFRRACFEQVGGYMRLPFGGIDAAAEIMARMKGWRVRKFPECRVLEHRRTGTAKARPLAAKIREGRRFHSLGYGGLFYLMRCIYRLPDQPVLIGSLLSLYGYLESILCRAPIVLPKDAQRYLRIEQRHKLMRTLGIPLPKTVGAEAGQCSKAAPSRVS